MPYLTTLCSLCLCHNTNLIKLSTVETKYVQFLKKLLNTSPENTIKIDEEYLCEVCKSKLESCQILSELCIRNKIYTKFCCMCLSENQNTLKNLRTISTNCASFYYKLIRSMRPQTFICEKCAVKFKYYLQFYEEIIKNRISLNKQLEELANATKETIFANTKPSTELETEEPTTNKITLPSTSILHATLIKKETYYDDIEIEDNFMCQNEPLPIITDIVSVNENTHQEDENLVNTENENLNNEIGNSEMVPSDEYTVYSGDNEMEEQNINESCSLNEETSVKNDVSQNEEYNKEDITENNIIIKKENVEYDENVSDIPKNEPVENIYCPYCPDNKNISNFHTHKLQHINRKRKKCLICGKGFKSIQTLCSHLLVHYRHLKNITRASEGVNKKVKQPRYEMVPTDEIIKKEVNDPEIQEDEPIDETYEEPSYEMNNLDDLEPDDNQMTYDMEEPPFICPYCPGQTNLNSFKEHKFHHMNRLNNQCLICAKKLASYKYLYRHVLKHFNTATSERIEMISQENTMNMSGMETYGDNFICVYCPNETNVTNFKEHKFIHLDRLNNQCLICSRQFVAYKYLYTHIKTHFKTMVNFENVANVSYKKTTSIVPDIDINFACPFCPQKTNIKSLKEHKFYHMNRINNQCLICMKRFFSYNHLYKHIMLHYKKEISTPDNTQAEMSSMSPDDILRKQFDCEYCPEKTTETFHKHIYRHMDTNKKTCLLCSKTFITLCNIREHILTHFINVNINKDANCFGSRKDFINDCPYCIEKVSGNLSAHVNIHMDKEYNTCLICSYVTPNYVVLQGHVFRHFLRYTKKISTNTNYMYNKVSVAMSTNKFKCPFCPDKEKTYDFETHKFVHMDEQKNECLICCKTYKYLREHIRRTHFKFLKVGNVKNVQATELCTICNMYISKYFIAQHNKTQMHMNNLEKMNTKKVVMKKLVIKKVENNRFTCSFCNKSYHQRGNWYRHVKYECKHSTHPKFSCQFCNAKFRRKYLCTKHMERIHGYYLEQPQN